MLPALNQLTLRAAATGTACDDVLGIPDLVSMVLARVDDPNDETVFTTVRSWNNASAANRASCRNAKDAWTTLTVRVFGTWCVRRYDSTDARNNFYLLLRRMKDYRTGRLILGDQPQDARVRAFVMAAVQMHGSALYFADVSFKKDPAVVMAAVKHYGYALEFADESIKKNPEVVMAAVKHYGDALQFAHESIKKNPEVVLAAVKQNGSALEYADESLKRRHDIVMAAVKQNGLALRFADESLKMKHDIVLAAVRQNGDALRFAHESLKTNPDRLWSAVRPATL